MSPKHLLGVGLGLALSTSGAFAQGSGPAPATPPPPPPCSGHYEIIRTDSIKPGKLNLFLKAVHDHQAWYTSHGYADHIMVGRILSPEHGPDGFSETLAVTVHTNMTSLHAPTTDQDAAWKAYVAEYNDSSEVTQGAIICIQPAP